MEVVPVEGSADLPIPAIDWDQICRIHGNIFNVRGRQEVQCKVAIVGIGDNDVPLLAHLGLLIGNFLNLLGSLVVAIVGWRSICVCGQIDSCCHASASLLNSFGGFS